VDHTDFAASVRTFVDEFNAGDPQAVQRHIAPDFYAHRPGPGEPTATEVWAELAADLRRGLPDLHVSVDELEPSADGERLTGRITLSGTHAGPLWGAPPSGASIRFSSAVSARPVDHRFAVNFDGVTTPDLMRPLRQMELVNPPDQMHLPATHPGSQVPEFVLRVAFTGQAGDGRCAHLDQIEAWETTVDRCEECVASGGDWPALRLCMSCGYVGCCDTSTRTHMKLHAEQTGHVLMRSIRLDEGWGWCYADNAFIGKRTFERLRASRAEGR
jgi:predicted ester cyclase